ncbi:hypothetical protein PR048_003036 [Dryococelus australis]|uniref:Uncharacterized protein n=1 Tax=Dryococelus australis TaxID=614101 RepID=A0ABQ9ILZ4_9NEOP|nr:hypothetical protein PR048_003036 [Dryococelus australis]
MALKKSSAGRVAKFREKVKTENPEKLKELLTKDRRGGGGGETEKPLKKIQLACNNIIPNKIIGSYASTSTLRKAFCKVKRNLPCSPQKKRAVVRQLVKETFNCPSELDIVTHIVVKISWQAPAKRDYISVKFKKTEHKSEKQKRLFVMTISEAHKIFMDKYKIKISLSKFHELGPKHIILLILLSFL